MTSLHFKQLRGNALFVIKTVSASIPGSKWSPGENPPDAYLHIGNEKVAIEITQLVQRITDKQGAVKGRWNDDVPAIKLIKTLNEELKRKIPSGCEVYLKLSAPIESLRDVKQQVHHTILEMIENSPRKDITETKEMQGNKITIHLIHTDLPSEKKMNGLITNSNSRRNTNVFENAKYILEDRIIVKKDKCKSITFKGPIWLALINKYWIADAQIYKQAYKQLTIPHQFDNILLVEENGAVTSLYNNQN